MFAFYFSSQNITVLVMKLLFLSYECTLHTQLFDAGAGTLPTTFLFSNWLPIRFCQQGVLEQVQKTEGSEREFPFLLARSSCQHCPALALHLGQQPQLLDPNFFATLRMPAPTGWHPPSDSRPNYPGVFFQIPQVLVLTLQCLFFQVLGSRSVGSFHHTASSDNPRQQSLSLRGISYFL